MPRCSHTRGERAIGWVEDWCTVPGGRPVRLTAEERAVMYGIYDGGLPATELAIAKPMAAYIVLLHLVGPEARSGAQVPGLEVDVFTLWNAAGPRLREYLRRHGEVVVCPELGTRWSRAA